MDKRPIALTYYFTERLLGRWFAGFFVTFWQTRSTKNYRQEAIVTQKGVKYSE